MMPTDREIPICDIDEPEIPMRDEMDDAMMDELCADIRRNGLLQRIGLKDKGGRWRVVWGHRRFIACKRISLDPIPSRCYALDEVCDERQMFSENFRRENVNDGAVAVWLGQLVTERGLTEAQLMEITGKSADWIGDRFRLLNGDPEVLQALRTGKINMAVARELNKCKDDTYRHAFLLQAIDLKASQRQVSVWIQHVPVHSEVPAASPTPAPDSQNGNGAAAAALPCEWCLEDGMQHHIRHVPMHDWCVLQMKQALRQAKESA